MPAPLPKGKTPAYKGARFDTDGFCLAPNCNVRLCKITSDGQYKIIRKTCSKCGSAGLCMTDPHTHTHKKTNVHGYKKKAKSPRAVSSDLFGATEVGCASEHKRHMKRIDSRRGFVDGPFKDPPRNARRKPRRRKRRRSDPRSQKETVEGKKQSQSKTVPPAPFTTNLGNKVSFTQFPTADRERKSHVSCAKRPSEDNGGSQNSAEHPKKVSQSRNNIGKQQQQYEVCIGQIHNRLFVRRTSRGDEVVIRYPHGTFDIPV